MRDPLVRLFLCGIAGTLLGVWGHLARADTALATGIAAQPVAAALHDFAHQTRLQLVYVSQVVKNRTSKGARAGLSPAEGLTALLDGTGLGFEFLNPHTVRIFELPASAPAGRSLEATEPVSQREAYTSPSPRLLDDIVVTGSKNAQQQSAAEFAQNVAASVSIVSAATLERQKSETLLDYAAFLPGFNVQDFGYPGRRNVTLRGIFTLTQASSVAYYLDDAPMGATGSYAGACCSVLELTPYDLERLEVLRGPQGTVYGQESQVGVIRYVLKAPSLDAFDGRIGGDLNTVHGASKPGNSFRAMINVPVIAEVLGVIVSGYETHTPGYLNNRYSGANDVNTLDQYGARVAALWHPAESLSLKFNATWNRIDSADAPVVAFTGAARVPNTGDAFVLSAIGPLGDVTKNTPFLGPYKENIDHYSATASWRPGTVDIVSTTSWSRTANRQGYDNSGVGSLYPQLSGGTIPVGLAFFHDDWDLEKFSEELRLLSPQGERFGWSLGGFYTREHTDEARYTVAFDNAYRPIATFAPYLSYSSIVASYSDLAVFGDLTWRVTGHLDLTAGARTDLDTQAFTDAAGGVLAGPPDPPARSSERTPSWTAAVRFHFTPDSMWYARAATGYQPNVPPTAKAETLINYEVGVKSALLDHKALVDLTLFYIDWQNVQIAEGNAPLGVTTNGAQGRSEGMELASAISPSSGLNVGCVAAYTEAGLTRVVPGPPLFLLAGYQMPNVPKWSLSLTADYDWQPTDRWQAHLGGVYRWVDQEWGTATYIASEASGAPAALLPSYSVLDLNGSITTGALTLRVFARNVADARARLQSYFGVGVPNAPAQSNVAIIQPRTIGVGFEYAF